ncbi:single-stranded DNA-binding protein (plasmid) [Streptosporangium sp. CA-135522]|uniref:single-stranded DNA-binding protein n=1 Tax=Streptosporangium sp. CA-135522 TaxID=3240072 RepID=UPI003D90918C
MAAGDTTITIVGNLVDEPELRFTPTGQPIARFRIASTPRYLDQATNTWKDGESLFLTCQIWRRAAENVAESLQRGMRVIVQGRLRQRSYETKEGEKRTVYEVEVDEVGPSLRNATAKVDKNSRQGGNRGPAEWENAASERTQQASVPPQAAAAPAEAPASSPWETEYAAAGSSQGDAPPF